MIRRFFHYRDLEEYKCGMWRIVHGEERARNARNAADLMRDRKKFCAAMLRALREWPNSCQHNLTAEDTNRLAFLGHAGWCIAVGSPEENTRIGWHLLNPQEQDCANDAAQEVLDLWIKENCDQMEMFPC